MCTYIGIVYIFNNVAICICMHIHAGSLHPGTNECTPVHAGIHVCIYVKILGKVQ